MTNHWTITLEQDPETGELILPFPDGIVESFGWKIGDTLSWTDNSDGSWTISKVEQETT
jgi:hypothetical protein